MVFFAIRRARLRPEFAGLYPEVAPGIWLSAHATARAVRRANARRHRPAVTGGARLLPDGHFEFRGGHGQSLEAAMRRTRVGLSDPLPASAEG